MNYVTEYCTMVCNLHEFRRILFTEHLIDIHAYGASLFISACKRGHIDIIKHLIETCSEQLIDIYNGSGFRYACLFGYINIVKYLIDITSNPDCIYSKQRIDIHYENDSAFTGAYMNKHMDVVKYLIDISYDYSGRIVNIHENDYIYIYHACIFNITTGEVKYFKYLLNIGYNYSGIPIDIHCRWNMMYRTALYEKHITAINYLIANGSYNSSIIDKYTNSFLL